MAVSVQVIVLLVLHASFSQQAELPNECERGVKRHHPSQANLFQVFTRRNLLKQWIDYECQKYTIFDPRKCACVERPREEQPDVVYEKVKEDQRVVEERDRGRKIKTVQYSSTTENKDNEAIVKDKKVKRNKDVSKRKSTSRRNDRDNGEQDSPRQQEDIRFYQRDSESESDCHLHQPSPESPSQFERWTDGQWITEDCNFPFYTGLVWNQDKCRCEWGSNRTAPIAMQDDMTPATCLMMFHLTFDNAEIKDVGRGVWINIRNKEDAKAMRDSTAVGGFSGYFRGVSMAIPFFKSNIIGPIFHIGFMYKLCPGNPDTDIILVHNDCKETFDGPSLVVSYQSWKQQIIIAMKTSESDLPRQEYCALDKTSPQNSWLKVDIRYQDNYMEVTANGEVCVSSEKFYGPLATNNCPLTLLGESFCGNLDEVIITRGCTEAHAIS